MQQLVDVAKLVYPEVDGIGDTGRRSHRLGDHGLAAVARGADACRDVYDRAEIVALTLLGLALMQADPNLERRTRPIRTLDAACAATAALAASDALVKAATNESPPVVNT